MDLHGFFVHLEWDANDHSRELRLLLDMEHGASGRVQLLPQAIHLGEWDLEVAVRRAFALAEHNARTFDLLAEGQQPAWRAEIDAHMGGIVALYTSLVSVILYVCSVNAELAPSTGPLRQPGYPTPIKTKRGPKLLPASQPTTWDVGYRLGAALRAGGVRGPQPAVPEGLPDALAQRAKPRAHLRRAHWHSYWTGPGRTQIRVHWVHPVLVGGTDVLPTIHPVDPD
jgi:hypothetical protein